MDANRVVQIVLRVNGEDADKEIKDLERARKGVTRDSKDWDEITEVIAKTKKLADIKKEGTAVEFLSGRISDFGSKWGGIITMVQGAVEGLTGVKAVMSQSVQDYAEMKEHMAGVRKYTELGEEAVKDLNEVFKQMDTRTPHAQLNDLAADAGRCVSAGKNWRRRMKTDWKLVRMEVTRGTRFISDAKSFQLTLAL